MTSTTLTPTEITEHIVEHSRANGGGTFAAADAARPVSGFAVTVGVLDTLPGKALFIPQVEPYLMLVGEGNYLGTWYDEANDCWEISETVVIEKRDDALRAGRMLSERYIYDLAADECVPVA